MLEPWQIITLIVVLGSWNDLKKRVDRYGVQQKELIELMKANHLAVMGKVNENAGEIVELKVERAANTNGKSSQAS